MKLIQVLSLAACVLPAVVTSASSKSSVTPVQKVLEMLDGMLEKGKKDKHDENVRFSSFKQWCESTKTDKDRLIKAAADKIGDLEADITQSEADAAKNGDEIAGHEKDINGWTSEADASNAQRKAENTEYQATHLDYSESIDALERAIQVLKKRSKDVPQSLVQLREVSELKRLPSQARHVLASFLQASALSETGAPEANAYEFQSTSVVDMLEKLRLRFQDERLALEKEEMNKKAAFEQMLQKLTDDIKYGKEQVDAKSVAKSQAEQDAATAKGDLAETQEGKAADETFLRDTLAECHGKSKEYEIRQVTRATEIEAIQKAIEIMSSPEVSGAADKHLPGAALLQEKQRPTVFAQLRKSVVPENSSVKAKVVSMLLQASQEAKSDLLASVANRVGEDPFSKVKKMIKDLITKLMEEANAEADHKGFCDEELANNKATRDEKTSEVTELTAQIDELTAKNAKLTQDIADLAAALEKIEESLKEATETRAKEKAANLATLADGKAASAAVTKAIGILKKFYAKAATATAFAQAAEEKPETWDESYKGMQSESGGVVGMLEVIQSDFARLEAETSSAEDEAARDHEAFLADSEKDKAVKEKEKRHNGFEKVRTERALNQSKKDLAATQAELDAALEYYEKLKPQCVDNGLSYEDRVAKRKAEILSLQEALKVLSGEDI
jgi:hypothetical protein